jgi:hypothetical protein
MDIQADRKISEDTMSLYGRGSSSVLSCGLRLMLAVFVLSGIILAQDEAYPKWDIYTGYQWLQPGGTVPSPFGTSNNPFGSKLRDLPDGATGAVTYNFDKYLGLEGEYGKSWGNQTNEGTLSAGPRLMLRSDPLSFFAHGMLSWNRLSAPGLSSDNGIGAVVGGGMDLRLMKWLSWRMVEADYVWGEHHYDNYASPSFPSLRRPDLNGLRIGGGLVWNFGYPNAAVPAASCSVQPSEVMVGEPITATATGTNFNPKHTLTYTWSSTGGKISGNGNTASIDTNNIAGGSYTATAQITDPKMKKNNQATCTANFTVKEPPKNPPTMSCTADPSSVQAGGTVNVTCNCTSPDNVPVNVSNWNATGGTVSGSGSSATLNTTGASAGPITVSATCTDSRGLNTQASTQVTVQNPPPPPPPQASKLTDCDFTNMAKIGKPWRVDNECKGKLDDVAKNLQQNADNKLVIVGNAEPTEKRKNLAAERAVNSKAYLTSGEAKLGIDPGRIECRTGSAGTKSAEYWIVPAGGTFSEEGTQPVDESMVKPVPDHPRARARKKAAQ